MCPRLPSTRSEVGKRIAIIDGMQLRQDIIVADISIFMITVAKSDKLRDLSL